jgi:hypothetical protein
MLPAPPTPRRSSRTQAPWARIAASSHPHRGASHRYRCPVATMTKSRPHAIVYLNGTSPWGGTPTMEPTMMTVDQAARANGGFDVSMRVGQAWVGPDEREAMPVIDPSTGKAIADVPVATAEDAQSALEAAQRAQPAWAALTPRERAEYLQRVAQLVRADAERLSRLISHEEGKPCGNRESRSRAGRQGSSSTSRPSRAQLMARSSRRTIAVRRSPSERCPTGCAWASHPGTSRPPWWPARSRRH